MSTSIYLTFGLYLLLLLFRPWQSLIRRVHLLLTKTFSIFCNNDLDAHVFFITMIVFVVVLFSFQQGVFESSLWMIFSSMISNALWRSTKVRVIGLLHSIDYFIKSLTVCKWSFVSEMQPALLAGRSSVDSLIVV